MPAMNRRIVFFLIFILLVGCAPVQTSQEPVEAQVLAQYIQALVAKDEAAYSRLICPDWEAEAFLEYDAYLGVKTDVKDVSCKRTGNQNEISNVVCQGKILLNYGNEKQEVDLASRVYQLKPNAGSWQVCGFTPAGQ